MKKISLFTLALLLPLVTLAKPQSDREYWAALCYKISEPVLSNMAEGKLKEVMPRELSPTWDGRNPDVTYLEAFGRLMAGIAPWLALPDDNTSESQMRSQLRNWALESYVHAVDKDSPDYLVWEGLMQPLVDAAYLAQSFIRAPEALWEPLDEVTKTRYIEHFRGLRKVRPAYNNWILFRAMIEAFFISIGEEYDGYVMQSAIRKIDEWYMGDGWYGDGPEFSLDYYNSYVIHPMLVEIAEVMENHNIRPFISFDLALRRMQRFDRLLERLISPEATFPPIGRSMTYRMGTFQTLALSAWKYGLHPQLTNGQVRSALTAVMKRLFADDSVFNSKGFLQLGFTSHYPGLADYYTNTGSLYITSLVFMPLGLNPSHDFWTSEAEPWTSVKAWSGQEFPRDYHESVRK